MKDILLITIDSLRPDHIGCYGYDRDITPTLDSFSQEAQTMTQAFANGCSTPISFPSILSSSYALHYGGYPPHNKLSEERTLISEVLQAEGVETAGLHSNPHLFEELGYGRGFDTFFDSQSGGGRVSRLRNYINNNFSQGSPVYRVAKKLYYAVRSTGLDPGLPYVRAEEITDRTIDTLSESSGRQFVWAHYMDVHNLTRAAS